MDCTVRTGTVDFSTTILLLVATSAIFRAQSSQFLMLAARPAPIPVTLVGVFTETKMMSASAIAPSKSVEKNKFLCFQPKISQFQAKKRETKDEIHLPRACSTTSCSPGS